MTKINNLFRSRNLLFYFIILFLSSCERYYDKPLCGEYFINKSIKSGLLKNTPTYKYPNQQIIWYRCRAGETFSKENCFGNPLKIDYLEASSYAKDFSRASGRSWRLPTVQDAKVLIEKKCVNPAINTKVFPTVVSSNFWLESGDKKLGCTLNTYNGSTLCRADLSDKNFVLLVTDDY